MKHNQILRRVKNQRGFTLVEIMAVLVIMVLISGMIVTIIGLAFRQYSTSMRESEAQGLYSTLQTVIISELQNTTAPECTENGADWKPVTSFFSTHYALESTTTTFAVVDGDGNLIEDGSFGRIVCGGYVGGTFVYNGLLGNGSYPNGLGVRIVSLTYQKPYFRVQLQIGYGDKVIIDRTFDVYHWNYEP